MLRTKTTVSPGRPPTKRATSSRASSNAEVAICDFTPAPRCTLLYQGMKRSTASQTSTIADVLAALSRFT